MPAQGGHAARARAPKKTHRWCGLSVDRRSRWRSTSHSRASNKALPSASEAATRSKARISPASSWYMTEKDDPARPLVPWATRKEAVACPRSRRTTESNSILLRPLAEVFHGDFHASSKGAVPGVPSGVPKTACARADGSVSRRTAAAETPHMGSSENVRESGRLRTPRRVIHPPADLSFRMRTPLVHCARPAGGASGSPGRSRAMSPGQAASDAPRARFRESPGRAARASGSCW